MRLFGILLVVLSGSVRAQGDDPHFQVSTSTSDTGTYTLTWTAPGSVQVQEATSADFSNPRTLYEGVDQATVVSGRLDGTFHYRLLRDGVPWGSPVSVEVVHHSLRQATAFLAAGAIVFVATVLLIVQGHRRHRREFVHQGESTS